MIIIIIQLDLVVEISSEKRGSFRFQLTFSTFDSYSFLFPSSSSSVVVVVVVLGGIVEMRGAQCCPSLHHHHDPSDNKERRNV